jgi:hypothetical protein
MLGDTGKRAVSQRNSGHQRIAYDAYQTPEWCTEALIPHLCDLSDKVIWEPAAGAGQMVRVLERYAKKVIATDIVTGTDFLTHKGIACDGLVSNPPYTLAQQFIEHALRLEGVRIVAMLLRADYDSAATRAHLFAGCPAFAKKIVLTKRIRWFEDSNGSPSFNHAWFLHDHQHAGPPVLAYGPATAQAQASEALCR